MSKVNITAGICGFHTEINAESDDGQNVDLEIISECPNFQQLQKELTHADAYAECFGKVGEGQVYSLFRKYCPHAACPVPCGVIKAIEVSAGLALPSNAVIEIHK